MNPLMQSLGIGAYSVVDKKLAKVQEKYKKGTIDELVERKQKEKEERKKEKKASKNNKMNSYDAGEDDDYRGGSSGSGSRKNIVEAAIYHTANTGGKFYNVLKEDTGYTSKGKLLIKGLTGISPGLAILGNLIGSQEDVMTRNFRIQNNILNIHTSLMKKQNFFLSTIVESLESFDRIKELLQGIKTSLTGGPFVRHIVGGLRLFGKTLAQETFKVKKRRSLTSSTINKITGIISGNKTFKQQIDLISIISPTLAEFLSKTVGENNITRKKRKLKNKMLPKDYQIGMGANKLIGMTGLLPAAFGMLGFLPGGDKLDNIIGKDNNKTLARVLRSQSPYFRLLEASIKKNRVEMMWAALGLKFPKLYKNVEKFLNILHFAGKITKAFITKITPKFVKDLFSTIKNNISSIFQRISNYLDKIPGIKYVKKFFDKTFGSVKRFFFGSKKPPEQKVPSLIQKVIDYLSIIKDHIVLFTKKFILDIDLKRSRMMLEKLKDEEFRKRIGEEKAQELEKKHKENYEKLLQIKETGDYSQYNPLTLNEERKKAIQSGAKVLSWMTLFSSLRNPNSIFRRSSFGLVDWLERQAIKKFVMPEAMRRVIPKINDFWYKNLNPMSTVILNPRAFLRKKQAEANQKQEETTTPKEENNSFFSGISEKFKKLNNKRIVLQDKTISAIKTLNEEAKEREEKRFKLEQQQLNILNKISENTGISSEIQEQTFKKIKDIDKMEKKEEKIQKERFLMRLLGFGGKLFGSGKGLLSMLGGFFIKKILGGFFIKKLLGGIFTKVKGLFVKLIGVLFKPFKWLKKILGFGEDVENIGADAAEAGEDAGEVAGVAGGALSKILGPIGIIFGIINLFKDFKKTKALGKKGASKVSWKGFLDGASLGAGVGALVGAPFFGIGAVPGAAIGGLLGGLIGLAIPEIKWAAGKVGPLFKKSLKYGKKALFGFIHIIEDIGHYIKENGEILWGGIKKTFGFIKDIGLKIIHGVELVFKAIWKVMSAIFHLIGKVVGKIPGIGELGKLGNLLVKGGKWAIGKVVDLGKDFGDVVVKTIKSAGTLGNLLVKGGKLAIGKVVDLGKGLGDIVVNKIIKPAYGDTLKNSKYANQYQQQKNNIENKILPPDQLISAYEKKYNIKLSHKDKIMLKFFINTINVKKLSQLASPNILLNKNTGIEAMDFSHAQLYSLYTKLYGKELSVKEATYLWQFINQYHLSKLSQLNNPKYLLPSLEYMYGKNSVKNNTNNKAKTIKVKPHNNVNSHPSQITITNSVGGSSSGVASSNINTRVPKTNISTISYNNGGSTGSGTANISPAIFNVPIPSSGKNLPKNTFKALLFISHRSMIRETGFTNPIKAAAQVSHTKGDYGGASYGILQLTVRYGNVVNFLKRYGYYQYFQGLSPGSPQFDAMWKKLAHTDMNFVYAQLVDGYNRFFKPANDKIKTRLGIDISKRSLLLQQLLWGTAVQYGPYGAANVFIKALSGQNVSSLNDLDIINIVERYKIATVNEYFRDSSYNVQMGVKKRFERSLAYYNKMAGNSNYAQNININIPSGSTSSGGTISGGGYGAYWSTILNNIGKQSSNNFSNCPTNSSGGSKITPNYKNGTLSNCGLSSNSVNNLDPKTISQLHAEAITSEQIAIIAWKNGLKRITKLPENPEELTYYNENPEYAEVLAKLYKRINKVLGWPYIWGGTIPPNHGADCSGFMLYVMNGFGYTINQVGRTAYMQSLNLPRQAGSEVIHDINDLIPGDMLYFKTADYAPITHTAVYVGDGFMAEAYGGEYIKGQLQVDNLPTTEWFRRTFRFAVRPPWITKALKGQKIKSKKAFKSSPPKTNNPTTIISVQSSKNTGAYAITATPNPENNKSNVAKQIKKKHEELQKKASKLTGIMKTTSSTSLNLNFHTQPLLALSHQTYKQQIMNHFAHFGKLDKINSVLDSNKKLLDQEIKTSKQIEKAHKATEDLHKELKKHAKTCGVTANAITIPNSKATEDLHKEIKKHIINKIKHPKSAVHITTTTKSGTHTISTTTDNEKAIHLAVMPHLGLQFKTNPLYSLLKVTSIMHRIPTTSIGSYAANKYNYYNMGGAYAITNPNMLNAAIVGNNIIGNANKNIEKHLKSATATQTKIATNIAKQNASKSENKTTIINNTNEKPTKNEIPPTIIINQMHNLENTVLPYAPQPMANMTQNMFSMLRI